MGELEQRLHDDMVAAMRERDKPRTDTLRMAIAAIRSEKVAGKQARELTGEEELAVVRREVNKRRDSAEAYSAANRPELAEKEMAEAALLSGYLPEPLSDAELSNMVAEEIAALTDQTGVAPTMKHMGQIVRAVNARSEGRAEGRAVAAEVRKQLG
jgi:uncharacterized protein YqeY